MPRHQDGYIWKVGGSWYGRWREDVIENGTVVRKQRSEKLAEVCDRYRSKADVRPVLEEKLRAINQGRADARSTMTLADFVEGYYLPYVQENLKPSTSHGYVRLWRVCLSKRVGGIRLRDFRTVDAAKLLENLATRLGRRSLQHTKSILSGIFTHAKNVGALDGINPVHEARIPRKAKAPGETHGSSRAEVQTMLDLLDGQPTARAALGLMFFGGLRPGEARGVRWEDYETHCDGPADHIDWRIVVRRSVWRNYATAPKTESSSKPIPVIAPLRLLLEELRAASGNPKNGFVLCGRSGRPLNLNNLAKRVIVPALKRCLVCKNEKANHQEADHEFRLDESLPQWRGWYALRRGIATELLAATKDPLAAKGLLRHSSVSTTMAHYVKDVPEATVRGMERLEELYKKGAETEDAQLAPASGFSMSSQ